MSRNYSTVIKLVCLFSLLANQVDMLILRVHNNTDCPCSPQMCRRAPGGYRIAVALIKSIWLDPELQHRANYPVEWVSNFTFIICLLLLLGYLTSNYSVGIGLREVANAVKEGKVLEGGMLCHWYVWTLTGWRILLLRIA